MKSDFTHLQACRNTGCPWPLTNFTTGFLKGTWVDVKLKNIFTMTNPENIRTLVIHPYDLSTDFLASVYAPVRKKLVVSHGISKRELADLIRIHDRILMMGHGSPEGLLSVGRFRDASPFIIDHTMADLLRKKANTVFIWCHADEFVVDNRLNGFYSGMFISETQEARDYGLSGIHPGIIRESNYGFSRIMSRYINSDKMTLWENVTREYSAIASSNRVAAYNLRRLFVQ